MIYIGRVISVEIIVILMIIFIISFLLLFKWIYSSEKKESKAEKLNLFHVVITAFTLALILTIVMTIIILVLLGSTNIANFVFSLQLGKSELIKIAIYFFIYLILLDNIVEIIVKLLVGKDTYPFVLFLIHIFFFYMIGLFAGLNQLNSFSISFGVAFIILLIETLYNRIEKSKK